MRAQPKKRTQKLNQSNTLPHIRKHAQGILPEKIYNDRLDQGWCFGMGFTLALSLVPSGNGQPFYAEFDRLVDVLESAFEEKAGPELKTIILDMATRQNKISGQLAPGLIGIGLLKPDAFGKICQKRLITPGACLGITLSNETEGHIIFVSKTPDGYALIDVNLPTLLIETKEISDIDKFVNTHLTNPGNKPAYHCLNWIVPDKESALKSADDELKDQYLLCPNDFPGGKLKTQVENRYLAYKTQHKRISKKYMDRKPETFESDPQKILETLRRYPWLASPGYIDSLLPEEKLIKAKLSSDPFFNARLVAICNFFSKKNISTSKSCYSHVSQYLFVKMMIEPPQVAHELFGKFMKTGYLDVVTNGRTYRLKDDGFRNHFKPDEFKPVTHYDFRGQDLSDLSFKECSLSNANFSGAIVLGTNFANANLAGANFIGAVIDQKTNFAGANLVGAKFGAFSDRLLWKKLTNATLSNDPQKGVLLKRLCHYLGDGVFRFNSYSGLFQKKSIGQKRAEYLFSLLMQEGDAYKDILEKFKKTGQIKGIDQVWSESFTLKSLMEKPPVTQSIQTSSIPTL